MIGVSGSALSLGPYELGTEMHEIVDTDLFKIFLNDDEMSKSSPDSSQSGSESGFDSPPLTPTSPFSSFATKQKVDAFECQPPTTIFWNNIKEEPKDCESPISNNIDESSEFSDGSAEVEVDFQKAPFALSRDDLLKLSSKSLETYAQNLAATRPLTEEEERQLKRQRRLIKNRESAQLSRQRKRMFIEELESQVSGLQADNRDLVKQVASLTSENQALKDELRNLQALIKQPGMGTTTAPPNQSVSPTPALIKVEQDYHLNLAQSMKPVESIKQNDACTSTLQYIRSHPDELKKLVGKDKKKCGQGKKRKKGETEETDVDPLSYIICTDAHEIPAAKRTTNKAENSLLKPSMVSFLLPSSSVSQLFQTLSSPATTTLTPQGPQNVPSSLIELSCQILETKAHPLSCVAAQNERVAK
jgi:regulator of replication initiation timing